MIDIPRVIIFHEDRRLAETADLAARQAGWRPRTFNFLESALTEIRREEINKTRSSALIAGVEQLGVGGNVYNYIAQPLIAEAVELGMSVAILLGSPASSNADFGKQVFVVPAWLETGINPSLQRFLGQQAGAGDQLHV